MRIGILGGTFDPPHAGHVALAVAAQATLRLDRLHVVPVAQAPLREGSPTAPASERLLLARIAFDPFPWAVVDDREIRRGGLSWSIETAREIAEENPGAELYWILGADQLSRLHRWREPEELCLLVRLAVLAREGEPGEPDSSLAGVARVTRLRAPEVAVSSTDLRRRLAAGVDPGNALPSGVAAAIQARGLYR